MPESPSTGPTAVLANLSKHLVVLIPVALVLGLVAGLVFDLTPLSVLVLPLTMLMVFPMLVNFRLSELAAGKDAKAVGLAMGLDFIVLPLIAWGLAHVFFAEEPALYVGMVLAGLFPTSGMTISWTGFAKGNVGAAVKMTVIGLVAASLLAPFYLKVMAGAIVPVHLFAVIRTVLLVVGVPMLAGQITRFVLMRRMGAERFKSAVLPVLPGISTIGVLAIVFLAIGLKAQMIVSRPELLLVIAVPLSLFYAVNFALSTVVGRALLPRGDAIALVYGTVMRNLSIALGIAIASFGPEAALVLAIAYVVQVQAAAWYVKATVRLFGPAPAPIVEGVASAAR
ncbi:MAG: arsenic resistance protein [Coriobacteriia bacterium]|nr:arsenic resistance protein [Coriobacteriia bacterium]